MAYYNIMTKVEEVNESSYERTLADGKVETVHKIQFSGVIPGQRERVLCEIPLEEAPSTDTMDRWELEESWVVISADSMRALGFERSNARAGEKAVGALVVFQASAIREATAEERKKLQEERKAQKVKAKQQRKVRQAQKEEAKKAKRVAEQAEREGKLSA